VAGCRLLCGAGAKLWRSAGQPRRGAGDYHIEKLESRALMRTGRPNPYCYFAPESGQIADAPASDRWHRDAVPFSVRLLESFDVRKVRLVLRIVFLAGMSAVLPQRVDEEWHPDSPPRDQNNLVDKSHDLLFDTDWLFAVVINHALWPLHLDTKRLAQPRVVRTAGTRDLRGRSGEK